MSELIRPFPGVCAAGVEALGIGITALKGRADGEVVLAGESHQRGAGEEGRREISLT